MVMTCCSCAHVNMFSGTGCNPRRSKFAGFNFNSYKYGFSLFNPIRYPMYSMFPWFTFNQFSYDFSSLNPFMRYPMSMMMPSYDSCSLCNSNNLNNNKYSGYSNSVFAKSYSNANSNYFNMPYSSDISANTSYIPQINPYTGISSSGASSMSTPSYSRSTTYPYTRRTVSRPTTSPSSNGTVSTPSIAPSRTVSSKSSKIFDANTKLRIEKVRNGTSMPYLLIRPENVNPDEKLPVLVYLHGLYQRGSNPDLLESKEYDPAVIMKKWNLKNFRGYIICPQLPSGGSWCRKQTEKSVRNVLKEFQSTHNVDKDNISLIGFSLGGAGALYLANEMSDVFKKAVTLSPYEPGNLGQSMKIPTKAFAGGNDDTTPRNMTNGKLKRILGAENCKIIPGKVHGKLPAAVLCTDADRNGCSDIIEWLFS